MMAQMSLPIHTRVDYLSGGVVTDSRPQALPFKRFYAGAILTPQRTRRIPRAVLYSLRALFSALFPSARGGRFR